MTQSKFRTLATGAGAAALLAGGSLTAGDYGKAIIDDKMPIEAAPWTFCDIFDAGTLYEGDGFIREISVHARYHGQFISGDEEINGVTQNGYHEWHHRRQRVALQVDFAHGLKFFAEGNFPDGDGSSTGFYDSGSPVMNDWQDFYIEWEKSDDFFVRVGKQKQDFTITDEESSKRIKTVERAAIVNEVGGARPWGAVVGFKTGALSHEVGGWLYGQHADAPQWVDFQSNGGFNYALVAPLSDSTELHFDYVYSDNDGGATGSEGQAANGVGSDYEHGVAIGTESDFGRLDLVLQAVYGANRSGGGGIPNGNDTYGFTVMPIYEITEKLEAVFRYAYMSEGREQRPQRFGEQFDGDLNARQPVEDYHTFYGGLNYYICGDKLKLMAGYEIATGQIFNTDTDIETGQWQLAVRSYF